MHFGSDFFKWMAFVVRLIQVLVELFGNDDEVEAEKKDHVVVNGK